jgi:hypothetical protein
LENKVKEILTSSQFERYQQLKLQMQGAGVIGSPEISQKLGLSEDQRNRIREIMQNDRPPMGPGGPGGPGGQGGPGQGGPGQGGRGQGGGFGQPGQNGQPGDFEQMRKMMMQHRQEVEQKVLAVLTSDQRQKWQDMLGKPFKFEEPQRGPGGFPGGPGGPPPPGGPGGGGN